MELQTQKPPEENQQLDAEQVVMRLKERKLRKMVKETSDYISSLIEQNDENYLIYLKAFHKLKGELNELENKLGTVIS